MSFRSCMFLILTLIAIQDARAQSAEEISKRYDPEHTNRLEGERLRVFRLHQADPVLAKYDKDNDGTLDKAEFEAMLKDLRQKYAGKSKSGISGPVPKEELRVAEQSSWEAANGGFPISALAQPPKSVPNGCDTTPSLYIRKNPLDTFLYGIPDVAKAQGASVSFTDDFANRARSATIDGFAGVALFRDPCVPRSGPLDSSYLSGYVFAPFIDAHGTLSSKTPRTVRCRRNLCWN
jgi:hypothetical protein